MGKNSRIQSVQEVPSAQVLVLVLVPVPVLVLLVLQSARQLPLWLEATSPKRQSARRSQWPEVRLLQVLVLLLETYVHAQVDLYSSPSRIGLVHAKLGR